MFHLIDCPDKLPKRMVADRMILHAKPKLRSQFAMLSGTHRSVVHANLVRERTRLPSVKAGRDHRHMVDAAAFQRHVSTDPLVALSSKKLASAPNILDIRESIVVLECSLTKRGASHSQFWGFLHLSKQKLKVLRLKGHIRVQDPNNIKLERFHSFEARIEGIHFSSEMSFLPLRHAEQFDPWVPCSIPAHDLIGPIGRTIAYDHPPQRQIGLRDHRLKSQFNEPF